MAALPLVRTHSHEFAAFISTPYSLNLSDLAMIEMCKSSYLKGGYPVGKCVCVYVCGTS